MNTKSTELPSVWLVSGNDLLLGDVVYRTPNNGWSRSLQHARRFPDKASAQTMLGQIERISSDVIGVYVLVAHHHAYGRLTLPHLRDRFRDQGPTHRPDLARAPHGEIA